MMDPNDKAGKAQLDQLSSVFSAIAGAWSKGAPAAKPGLAARSASEGVDDGTVSLNSFAKSTVNLLPVIADAQRALATVNPKEQAQFASLVAAGMTLAYQAAEQPVTEAHLVPRAFLDSINAKLINGNPTSVGDESLMSSPTITITTITTTVASHPIITCNVA